MSRTNWLRVLRLAIGVVVCLWPFYALDHVNVRALTDALLPVFPIFAGFLILALTLQRDAGWLQRQNWRRVNIERREAQKGLDRQLLLLFLYILAFITMIIERGIADQESAIATVLTYTYLIIATAALYGTLFLPFEIRKMRVLPYDDLINEKREPRRTA